jgi:hypothetical protein
VAPLEMLALEGGVPEVDAGEVDAEEGGVPELASVKVARGYYAFRSSSGRFKKFSATRRMRSLVRRQTLMPRKKRVGFAHQPIGHEADPLLRGPVELDQC